MKKSAKEDKCKYIESMADEAENAAKLGDYHTVYQITNKLCGVYMPQNIPVKDKEGNALTTKRNNKSNGQNILMSFSTDQSQINSHTSISQIYKIST